MDSGLLLSVVLIICATYSRANSATYGDLANIEDYAYYAYLTDGYSTNLKCGGAIIDYKFILTAAHCLDKTRFYVFVGIATPDDLTKMKPYEVQYVKKFPQYKNTVWDDIGLIKLTKNLVLGPKVQVIALASVLPPTDSEVTILGFGKIDCTNDFWNPSNYLCNELQYNHLRTATVPIIDTGYGVMYTEKRNRTNCYADSGGPVVYNGEVVGIVTTGPHNGCSSQNTHASVPAKVKWIEFNILYSL